MPWTRFCYSKDINEKALTIFNKIYQALGHELVVNCARAIDVLEKTSKAYFLIDVAEANHCKLFGI